MAKLQIECDEDSVDADLRVTDGSGLEEDDPLKDFPVVLEIDRPRFQSIFLSLSLDEAGKLERGLRTMVERIVLHMMAKGEG